MAASSALCHDDVAHTRLPALLHSCEAETPTMENAYVTDHPTAQAYIAAIEADGDDLPLRARVGARSPAPGLGGLLLDQGWRHKASEIPARPPEFDGTR